VSGGAGFYYHLVRSRMRAELRNIRRTVEWPLRRRQIERRLELVRDAGPWQPGPKQCVVTSVVRDAEPYIEPFLEYYLGLGVTHVVLLDNGSADGTVARALAFPRVTVLRCTLPFRQYDLAFKRFLIERYGAGSWSLLVDHDERFDWPGSDRLPLRGLLEYLNARHFTAVMAVLVDMFPDGPPESWPPPGRETIDAAVWYDLSGLSASRPLRLRLTNRFADPEMRYYRGGLPYQVFGVRTVATKFALMHYVRGGRLSLRRFQHFCRGAHVADVSAVLRHYKFDRTFFERCRMLVARGQHYDQAVLYRAALTALENNPRLVLRGPTARRLNHVNQLVEEGLLRASPAYWEFVRSWPAPAGA
jgi:hypothetical protein